MQLYETEGYNYILTAICYFSKWVELIPLCTKTALEVAEALQKLICKWGVPAIHISDQGREFVNQTASILNALTGMDHRITGAYHPQANGLVEKANHTTLDALRKDIQSQGNWLDCLDELQMSVNASWKQSTGCSPYEIVTGNKMRLLADVNLKPFPTNAGGDIPQEELEAMQEAVCIEQQHQIFEAQTTAHDQICDSAMGHIVEAQNRYKKNYDRRWCDGIKLTVGMMVECADNTHRDRKGGKLTKKWIGPYVVTKILGNGCFLLRSLADGQVRAQAYNSCDLRPVRNPDLPVKLPSEMGQNGLEPLDPLEYMVQSEALTEREKLSQMTQEQKDILQDFEKMDKIDPLEALAAVKEVRKVHRQKGVDGKYDHAEVDEEVKKKRQKKNQRVDRK